jgi:hypothetical protein
MGRAALTAAAAAAAFKQALGTCRRHTPSFSQQCRQPNKQQLCTLRRQVLLLLLLGVQQLFSWMPNGYRGTWQQ